jgi:hypothetical protein
MYGKVILYTLRIHNYFYVIIQDGRRNSRWPPIRTWFFCHFELWGSKKGSNIHFWQMRLLQLLISIKRPFIWAIARVSATKLIFSLWGLMTMTDNRKRALYEKLAILGAFVTPLGEFEIGWNFGHKLRTIFKNLLFWFWKLFFSMRTFF